MIDSAEVRINGKWVVKNGRVHSDEDEMRIHELISNYLQYAAVDWSGWERLYKDPGDGRYWELTFPQGALQAGGPPELRCINENDATTKYSLKTST